MDLLSTSFLFQQFLDQRRYLKNVTPSTIEWNETAFKAFSERTPPDPAFSKTLAAALRRQRAPARGDGGRSSITFLPPAMPL